MRSKHSAVMAASLGLLLTFPLAAAEPDSGTATEPVAPPPTQREYQAQPLPEDTFKPSEEVSEDYPVPFPVDI